MKELRDLKKVQLEKILGDDIIITPKHFGNTIIAEVRNYHATYFRKNGIKISVVDLLSSNLYSNAIFCIDRDIKYFKDGTYNCTHDYKNDKIILNSYNSGNYPPKYILCKPLFVGKDDELSSLIKSRSKNKIIKRLNITDKNISAIIIRQKSKPANAFKISINVDKNKYVPSEMYNLVLSDVIRKINISELKKVLPPFNSQEYIYLAIIDKIFLNYLKQTKYDIVKIDFDYPEYMKVDVFSKLYLLSHPIRAKVSENYKLYDIYLMILLSFRKKHLKSNIYMTDVIKEKYQKIYDTIQFIMNNPSELTIPSFDEWSK